MIHIKKDEIVLPGEVLGTINDFENGENTYVFKKEIRSCILGIKQIKIKKNNETGTKKNTKKNWSHQTDKREDIEATNANIPKVTYIISVNNTKNHLTLPKKGDVVICKVTKVSFFTVFCEVLIANNKPLKSPFKGFICKGDAHIFETDFQNTFQCFKQGDIIRARVLGIGQNSAYKLSTVGLDFGVIIALNDNGDVLKRAAWNTMISPKDFSCETRKVSAHGVDFVIEEK